MADLDYTIKDSTYNQKNGRYVRGGTTEVSSRFVEWWERYEIQHDTSDLVYVLEAKYVGRPDLLSYAFYGTTSYKWIIMQYNDILDPQELVAGLMLLMPTVDKISSSFSISKIGGIPTTTGA